MIFEIILQAKKLKFLVLQWSKYFLGIQKLLCKLCTWKVDIDRGVG